MDKIEIRTLLKHYWKQDYSASAAARKIFDVEGEDVVTTATLNSAKLRKSVESNPYTSTRRLSAELGVAQRTVVRHLKAIDKVSKSCRQVPHDLTINQANRRIETCKKPLENPLDDRFIHQIVTSDEKWIYFSNPNKRNQWLHIDQVDQPVPHIVPLVEF